MCTASWITGPPGFELFFNRDEQRSRPGGHAPEVHTESGVEVVFPLDGQELGTWIAANEFGLVLCILNLYEADYAPATPRSRGLLVRELAIHGTAAQALAVLRGDDLAAYRGFTLAVFEVDATGALAAGHAARWDGVALGVTDGADVRPPFVSSGFDLPRVREQRLATWHATVGDASAPTAAELERYHASRLPEPGAYAVSMSRDDACTVSHTRVRVTGDHVSMHYLDGAPADGGAFATVVLPRRSASAR
ncbi:hypothetical protein Pla163_05530 [Planctomycetes bacterium Pla163]|uniref:Transport and Golgi organisation 2 n=1 Tax=Rohdeia mirabilis TaxID=2528008 RepID=A0A518CW74_9BACT|nr:hypothetical protein Pla163_05530 [Planctomycetes bacterium Pla163]